MPEDRLRRRSRSRSPRRRRRTRSRSRSRDRRRSPPSNPPLPPPPPAAPGDGPPPPLNSIHRARVVGVRPFGVFVEVPGHRRHALVPPHQVADGVVLGRADADADRVRALSYFARPGETVWAKITGLAPDPRSGGVRVTASLRAVDQATGADADPNGVIAAERPGGDRGDRGGAPRGPPGAKPPTDDPPALGVARACVARVAPYGVFVLVEGYTGTALVHASHVSDHLVIDRDAADQDKVAALAACVPSVGADCYVKIVAVDPPAAPGGPPRVSASLKLADQRTGADLDPHGLKWRPGAGRGGGGDAGGRAPLGAHAADRVAGDAVDWGHLAAETYGGGGKTYELVVGGDTEEDEGGAALARHHTRRHKKSRSPTPEIKTVEQALAILEKYGGGGGGKRKEKRRRSRERRRSRRSRSR